MRDFLTYVFLMCLGIACCVKCVVQEPISVRDALEVYMTKLVDPVLENDLNPLDVLVKEYLNSDYVWINWFIPETPIDTVIVPDVLQLVDSCTLQTYDEPDFRHLMSLFRTELPERVEIVWGIYREVFVQDFTEQGDDIEIMLGIISNFITADSVIVWDHTSTDNGVMVLDFSIFFLDSGGNWNQPGGYGIYFEWDGHRYYPWLQNEKSMIIGSLANYSVDDVTETIGALPSLLKFSMYATNIDSSQSDLVHAALLSGCKTGLTVDIRGIATSQERLEQYDYQDITLIK